MTAGEHPAVADPTRRKRHATAVAGLLSALLAAPDAGVRAYPTWTVRHLAVHLVGVHTMASLALETGVRERPTFELGVAPDAAPAHIEGAVHAAVARFLHAYDSCVHDEVWSFGTDRTPAFWLRRMTMEAILHRWDAEVAAGGPQPVPAGAALDAIDEFVNAYLRRAVRASTEPPGGTVLIAPDGCAVSWALDLPSAGITRDPVGREAGAVVTGDPPALWLWLNRRQPLPGPVAVRDHDGSGATFEQLLDGLGGPADPR